MKLPSRRHRQSPPSIEQLTLQVGGDTWFELDEAHIQPYRWLHSFFSRAQAHQTIGVTSALLGEGVTYTARRLAAVLALDSGEPIVLVDTSLPPAPETQVEPGAEAPSAQPGTAQVLAGEAELDVALQPSSLLNLHWLAAGAPTPHPATLLRSAAMGELLETLRARFGYVLLDLPPLLGDPNAVVLSEHCDGLLWVARAGVVPIPAMRRAMAMVERERVLGVVLNGSRISAPRWLMRLLDV